MVKNADGSLIGIRLPLFGYSGKVLVSWKNWNKLIREEIKRVRDMKGEYSFWSTNARTDIYVDDDVNSLPNVGTTTKQKFHDINITCVGDLKRMHVNDDIIRSAADKLKGVSKEGLEKFVDSAHVALETPVDGKTPPKKINHAREENPYKSKYGENWEEKLHNSKALSPYVPVTKLITHIIRKSEQVFADTALEKSWVFYHDALSLMTATDTVEWMKTQTSGTKTFLKRWILPEHGLGNDLKKRSPPGNYPEFMPLDNSLNRDVHVLVHKHVVESSRFPDEDERKFSLATPKSGESAYRRVYNEDTGVGPSSKGIVQDIEKTIDAMEVVRKAEGVFVPGLASRPGWRHIVGRSINHGGVRKRSDYDPYKLKRDEKHRDLLAMKKDPQYGGVLGVGDFKNKILMAKERQSGEVIPLCSHNEVFLLVEEE